MRASPSFIPPRPVPRLAPSARRAPEARARGPVPALPAGAAARARVPLLVGVVLVAALLPEGLSFYVGEVRLTLARVILIAVFPLVLHRAFGAMALGGARLVVSDTLVPVAVAWMVLAPSLVDGPARGLQGGGVIALEFGVAYAAGRTLLREAGQARSVARLFCLALALVTLVAALDVIAGRYVTHDLVNRATGFVGASRERYDYRFGILRAMGPLEHPILFGTLCMIAVHLAFALRDARSLALGGVCLAGLVISVSSAPLGGLFLGFALLLYGHLTRAIRGAWPALVTVVVVALAALFTFHQSPWSALLSRMAFSQESAYHRLLIWQYAGEVVAGSPWIGVGLSEEWARPDWMPRTVDSVWLRSAMTFGIPGAVLIAGCLVGAASRPTGPAPGRPSRLDPVEQRLGAALTMILAVLLYVGFTVHYWGASWILIGLLAGIRARLGERAAT